MSETSKGSKGNRYMRPCRGCGGSGGSFAHAYAQPGCNCPTCGGPVCPVCLGSGTVDDTPIVADALADAAALCSAWREVSAHPDDEEACTARLWLTIGGYSPWQVLHEIAHLLTGQGHTDAWRAKLLSLGGSLSAVEGSRDYHKRSQKPGRYRGELNPHSDGCPCKEAR